MRHRKAGKKLNRDTQHRQALRRNLARSLFLSKEGRIVTTRAKAKFAAPFVEKLITLGKGGDLASRRRALALLPDKRVVGQLFGEIAPRFAERHGGYTRILRCGALSGKYRWERLGDRAKQVLFSLTETGEAEEEEEAGEQKQEKEKKGLLQKAKEKVSGAK